jgi:hypothetical protein
MATQLLAAVVAAYAVAAPLVNQAFKVLGIKFYVSQQLAQMQAHYTNKFDILRAAGSKGPRRTLVEQIFKDYEDEIKFEDYCWVKKDNELICIKKDKSICKKERFGGIFPPIASIAKVLKPCTQKVEALKWKENWETMLKGYAKGYLSNLEFYVLQLEAIEQDMALLKF